MRRLQRPTLLREHWRSRPEWKDYILRAWPGGHRVHLVNDEAPERLSFKETAEQAFTRAGVPFRYVKTYVSVQLPESGSGYAQGYPHVHFPLDGTTLVHYLDPGDVPAPLDIFEDDEVVETIIPEAGLTVFIPNRIKHGVRKNAGTLNRIQFIATALP